MRPSPCLFGLALFLALSGPGSAQEPPPGNPDPEALEALDTLFRDRPKNPELLQRLATNLNLSVVSASNRMEQAWGAPANSLVFTRSELQDRGYRTLSELLDDLPGMDLARTYGDVAHTKAYLRGYRNTYGDPFLVLVDGQVFNHLWYFNSEIPLLAFPLSAVERVEVVYGPSSALYGPNALMGVIHILTTRNQSENGSQVRGQLSGGNNHARGADVSFFHKQDAFHLRISARVDHAELDPGPSEAYEWTKRKYLEDSRIWSKAFLEDPAFGPKAPSATSTRALDVRLNRGGTEVGLTYLQVETGFGFIYATDQSQSNGSWIRPEWSIHLKHTQALTATLESTTTLRWRRDGLDPRSEDLEAKFDPLLGSFVNRLSFWGHDQRTVTLQQDLDWWLGWRWSLNAGFRIEDQDLQKDYDRNEGYFPVSHPVIPPPLQPIPNNRIHLRPWGLYTQARWRLDDHNLLHLGLRHDHHPTYGASTNLRLAYAGRFGPWGLKVLHGEGFQEPSPRTLYGGFGPAGSNPALRPESSQTSEFYLSRSEARQQQSLSLYRVQNRDTVTYVANLGRREIWGLDLQHQATLSVAGLDRCTFWFAYSRLLKTKGEPSGDLGLTSAGEVGDLSKNKAWLGITAHRTPWQATLRARYLGPRNTVATNPLGRVAGATVLDLNLSARRGAATLQLAIQNLLNRPYFHPGVFRADAGNQPGAFFTDALGVRHWQGSGALPDNAQGYYNSLLPQPGRTFSLTLRFGS